MDNLTFLGILFIPIVLLAFLATLIVMPSWIEKAKKLGLVWKDVHKYKKKEKVPGSGGIAVFAGFAISILLYVGIKTFILQSPSNTVNILIALMTVILASFVGFIDDIFGWKTGGLSKKARLFMMFFIAVPLMVTNSGTSEIMGIHLGLFYPLILIPLAVMGAGTTFNFLAGYNGLESSQGVIILIALSIVSFVTGNLWLTVVSASMVAALLAFYLFNRYPAKVFPGDILTYAAGSLIAAVAILGNMEKIAIFFFIPYIIEVILKARGKFDKYSFSKVQKDESLEPLYPKIYGLEHVAVRILKKIKPSHKAYEWEVPMLINLFQIVVIALGFILFF